MMSEATNPFQSEPFYLTSHRPTFTSYDSEGNPEEPKGYVTVAEYNFDQEEFGGNWYFNLFGNRVFEGNGRIIVSDSASYHEPEFWSEEIDEENRKDFLVEYGMVFIDLSLADRFEDHIPFKGVTFSWRITKRTIVTEQEFTLVPPTSEYEFWTSTPGSVVETERNEEEAMIDFTLPDDFEEGKHDFQTIRDLSLQQMIDRGHIFPGASGTFNDGSPKYGYDSQKTETDLALYPYPPPDEDLKYEVIKKITITSISYLTDFVAEEYDPQETSSPTPFYNQE